MTQAARPRPLLAASILVWFAVALAYYYAFHRPFAPQFAVQAVLAARDVLCTALLFALGGSLGTRLLPALSAEPTARQAPLARLALRAAVGLGILSLLYLLVGSTLGTAAGLAWLLALG